MSKRLDLRSMLAGAILAIVLVGSIGAAMGRLTGSEILPIRFRVVEVTEPQLEWQHGAKVTLLKLAPWYGKISRDSQDWRLKNETQDLTLAVFLTQDEYQIEKDDILGFRLDQHLKAQH
jgi:hypothetical protein